MTESELQIKVADHLRLQYPSILFHSDYGSGVKLTARQAAIQRRQNGGIKGWPDMFIAKPRLCYHGLFIELKKEGTRLKKKNGQWATAHLAEQAMVLEALRHKGYAAEFAVGFDEAKAVIDEYLGGPEQAEVGF